MKEKEKEMVFKIASGRQKRREDRGITGVVKDKSRQVLQNEMDVKERRKSYFVELLSVGHDRDDLEKIPYTDKLLDITSRGVIQRALKKMKNDKTQNHLR